MSKLSFTRRSSESFYIGSDIKVTVVEAGAGRARISIEAPNGVVVDREEVREAKQRRASTSMRQT